MIGPVWPFLAEQHRRRAVGDRIGSARFDHDIRLLRGRKAADEHRGAAHHNDAADMRANAVVERTRMKVTACG